MQLLLQQRRSPLLHPPAPAINPIQTAQRGGGVSSDSRKRAAASTGEETGGNMSRLRWHRQQWRPPSPCAMAHLDAAAAAVSFPAAATGGNFLVRLSLWPPVFNIKLYSIAASASPPFDDGSVAFPSPATTAKRGRAAASGPSLRRLLARSCNNSGSDGRRSPLHQCQGAAARHHQWWRAAYTGGVTGSVLNILSNAGGTPAAAATRTAASHLSPASNLESSSCSQLGPAMLFHSMIRASRINGYGNL